MSEYVGAGDYCCTPDSGACCGPGSRCCAQAGKHEHDEVPKWTKRPSTIRREATK